MYIASWSADTTHTIDPGFTIAPIKKNRTRCGQSLRFMLQFNNGSGVEGNLLYGKQLRMEFSPTSQFS